MTTLTSRITTALSEAKGNKRALREVLYFCCGLFFMTLGSHLVVPLPFTPIPLSFMLMTVISLGLVMGPWRSASVVTSYLVLALADVPPFAVGIPFIAALPKLGYLIAMPFSAMAASYLYRKLPLRKVYALTVAVLVASALVYVTGLPWLAFYVGSSNALALGLYPFILMDLVRCAMLIVTFSAIKRS